MITKINEAINNYFETLNYESVYLNGTEYIKAQYTNGDGFRALTNTINKNQPIQITAQGLRLYLLKNGLSSKPQRFNTHKNAPCNRENKPVSADYYKCKVQKEEIAYLKEHLNEIIISADRATIDHNKEIGKLTSQLFKIHEDLKRAIDADSMTLTKTAHTKLTNSLYGFK